jgi:CBS domain-containing protein
VHTISDVLERDILTLSPDASIIEATRCMLEASAERAPVVDADGKLLGLLGRSGLLRALIQEGQ